MVRPGHVAPWLLGALCVVRSAAYSEGSPYANLTDWQRQGADLIDKARLPLRTSGRYITDKYKERVKWACVNWYGAYSTTHVVGGMEIRPMRDIVERIVGLGFNCVRAMYSVEGYVHNPIVEDKDLAGNPELQNRSIRFLELFDLHIKMMTDAGLMVIVNNHNSKSGWCCHYSQDEGLWYTPEYSEEQWIESLVFLANRYKNNPLVVAIDLRNEVHDYDGTHLTWGDGNPKTDWALAATTAGNRVLEVSPDVLIVVMAMCFGADLRPMVAAPIELMYPDKVVYQTHNYLEYQLFDNISKMVAPWKYLRTWVLFLSVLIVSVIVFLRQAWKTMGMPLPPLGGLLISLFGWIAALSLGGIFISKSMYDFAMLFCGFSAEVDFQPWVVGFSVVTSLSLLMVVLGCFMLYFKIGGAGGQQRGGGEQRSMRKVKLYEMTPVGNPISVVATAYGKMRNRDVDLQCDGENTVSDSPLPQVRTLKLRNGPDSPASQDSKLCGVVDDACHSVRCSCCDMCCTPGFGSCVLIGRNISGVLSSMFVHRQRGTPANWDCGLCVGLQVFILLFVLAGLFIMCYVYAHLIPTYRFAAWHFDRMWGFALKDGYNFTAPVWMGEFGQNTRGTYWLNFLRYLSSRDVDWAYWAINGIKWSEGYIDTASGNFFNYLNPRWENETFGLLEEDYWTIRQTWKVLDLQALMSSPSTWIPHDHPCDYEVNPSCGG